MHVHLVFWISLHLKNIIKKYEPELATNTIRKLVCCGNFEAGGPTHTKSGVILFSTLWHSNVHCPLQDLLRAFQPDIQLKLETLEKKDEFIGKAQLARY